MRIFGRLILLMLLGLPALPAQIESPEGAKLSAGFNLAVGVVYLINPRGSDLTPLADELVRSTKVGHLFNFEMLGLHSQVRIAEREPEFVFSVPDPKEVKLYLASVGGTKRTRNRRWFPWSSTLDGVALLPGIPIDLEKFGESGYKFKPRQPLDVGEYAIILSVHKLFSFGVDQRLP